MNPDEVFWRLGLAVAGGLLLATVLVAVAGLPALLGLIGAFAWSVFAAEVPVGSPVRVVNVRESVRGSEVSRGA